MNANTVIVNPGEALPDDPKVQASAEVARTLLLVAEQMVADYAAATLPDKDAIAAVFSGLTSAAANFARRHEFAEFATPHFYTIGSTLKSMPAGTDASTRVALLVIDLVNTVLPQHGLEVVRDGLLTVIANVGVTAQQEEAVAESLRDCADMLTDPERLTAAKHAAKLATMPVAGRAH